MLGLAEQVGGNPFRFILGIGDDDNFGWSGDHVDADHAVQLPLGFGHPCIAGTGDHIHRPDPVGSISERRNGLSPADAPYFVDARQMRCRHDGRVHFATGRWRDHDEAFDTCHLGRNGVHQNR